MRVGVDDAMCDGFGICASHCPDVFTLDDFGFASVDGDGGVPDGQERLAERAILDCPAGAIRVLD